MINKTAAQQSPAWACYATGAIVAWIVLVFSSIFALIGMSAIAASLDRVVVVGSTLFFIEVVVAGLLAGIASYYGGKLAYRWSCRRKPMTVYVLIGILLLFTVLSLPVPFTFVLRG